MIAAEQTPICSVAGDPFPDEVAQQLWDEVADASGTIAKIIDGIAWKTVGGDQTRSELTQVRDLLTQSVEILRRTHDREEQRFNELDRLYPDKVWADEDGKQPGEVRS